MPPTDRGPPAAAVERGAVSAITAKPEPVARRAAGAAAANEVPFGARIRMGKALIRAPSAACGGRQKETVPGDTTNRTAMVNDR
jgi:hypothetical protein